MAKDVNPSHTLIQAQPSRPHPIRGDLRPWTEATLKNTGSYFMIRYVIVAEECEMFLTTLFQFPLYK